MKCTEKERETCNMEKMGCEGCYYDKDKVEIGEYVRTKKGLIAKVDAYQDLTTYDDKGVGVTFHGFDTDKGAIADIEVAKHSKNIIDLIEIEDYVNGYKIASINEASLANDNKRILYTEDKKMFVNNDIKTIVTKEQFASIEYKI